MRIIMVVVSLIGCINLNFYNRKTIKFEKEVLHLYSNNFNECLVFDRNYNILINNNDLEEYLNNKGYDVSVYDKDGLVCIKSDISYFEQNCFYIEKNYR